MEPARLNHVNIAVPDAGALSEKFERLLGLQVVKETVVEDQGVRVVILDAGGATVEITEPLGDDTAVGRFLKKRGQGLHHLCFSVPDLDAAIRRLTEAGVRMVDESPRTGASGHRIAFVHPSSFGGVLVELTETG